MLACAALALATPAVGASTPLAKRQVRTVLLRPGRVTTASVPYPDALEFGGARYSASVKLLPPPAGEPGRRPNMRLIKILARGPVEGGSLYRVRIRNANAPGTLPARAVLTATTRVPAGS